MEMTQTLAEFVAEASYEDFPPEMIIAAKRGILDTLGVILAGSQEPCTSIAVDYCRGISTSQEATILGLGQQTAAPLAALINGTAGHALDFDDVQAHMHGHPSVPLLPVIMALGESLDLTGREAITAFVVGVEVESKLGIIMGNPHYQVGWHATATLGTMGATMMASKLLGLDHEGMRMALGIATSMASGSRQNFGTMTKPLHAGLAARNGIEASLLAAKGFTADVNILESPMGFCRLFSPTEDFPTRSLEQLGDPWEILNPGLSVKKYPCCYATHNALDATLSLVQEHEIKVEEVKEVAVKVRPEVPAVLIHPRPQKGLEGKFSMQYCLAAAILDRKIALASFADQAVQRPEAQTLIQRVHMQEAFAASDASLGLEAEVTIDLEDGRSVSRRVDIPRGDAQSPLSWEELEEKFLDCASQALSEVKAQKALELIRGLEQTSLRELAQTLAGS